MQERFSEVHMGNPGYVVIEGRVSTNLSDWAVGAPGSVMVENTEAQLILRSTTPVENEPHQFMGAEIVLP